MKTKKYVEEKNDARNQAKAQLDSIKEMVANLLKFRNEAGNNASHPAQNDLEAAATRIQEDPLSVEVRSEWHTPGSMDVQDAEYNILLCTGGPAVRLIGALESGEPSSARLEYQDWGTPWTEYRVTAEEEETLLEYARCFYFGE